MPNSGRVQPVATQVRLQCLEDAARTAALIPAQAHPVVMLLAKKRGLTVEGILFTELIFKPFL